MAVATSAHALLKIVSLEEILPVITAEFAALVRMQHRSLLWLTTPYRHDKRIQSKLLVHLRPHGPADYLEREQVQDRSQI